MAYKVFHCRATVLVYDDGNVTVSVHDDDAAKMTELYGAFETLPEDKQKPSEGSVFESINALDTQVFVSRLKKK